MQRTILLAFTLLVLLTRFSWAQAPTAEPAATPPAPPEATATDSQTIASESDKSAEIPPLMIEEPKADDPRVEEFRQIIQLLVNRNIARVVPPTDPGKPTESHTVIAFAFVPQTKRVAIRSLLYELSQINIPKLQVTIRNQIEEPSKGSPPTQAHISNYESLDRKHVVALWRLFKQHKVIALFESREQKSAYGVPPFPEPVFGAETTEQIKVENGKALSAFMTLHIILKKEGPPCSLGYDEQTNSLLVDRRDGVSNEVKKLLDQFYPKPKPAPPVAERTESPAPAAVDSKADIKPLDEKLLEQELLKFVGTWRLISVSEHRGKLGELDGMTFKRKGNELEVTSLLEQVPPEPAIATLEVSDVPERIRRIIIVTKPLSDEPDSQPSGEPKTIMAVYEFSGIDGVSDNPPRLKMNFTRGGKFPISMEERGQGIHQLESELILPREGALGLPASAIPGKVWVSSGTVIVAIADDGKSAAAYCEQHPTWVTVQLDSTIEAKPVPIVGAIVATIQHGNQCHAYSPLHRAWVTLTLPAGEEAVPSVGGFASTATVQSKTQGEYVFKDEWGKWFSAEEIKTGKVVEHLAALKAKAEETSSPAASVTKIFSLQHAQATDAVDVLKQLYDLNTVKIAQDARTNAVIVSAPADRLREIEALIQKLDETGPVAPATTSDSLASEAAKLIVQLEDERVKLLQNFGPKHPKVKELDARLEQARSRLSSSSLPEPAADSSQQIAQLRKDYDAADAAAHRLAEQLRQPGSTASKDELRKSVERAFQLRQSLLRAELSEMLDRLAKTQHSIDLRDRITDQIVTRRVEDLLNPQLEWDESKSGTQPVTPSTPSKETAQSPQNDWVAKLQGHWQLTQYVYETVDTSNGKKPQPGDIKRENWTPETYYRKKTFSMKAMFDGNRVNACMEDGSNPATFELTFRNAGPPQHVDLAPVFNEAELAELKQMDEETNSSTVVPTFQGIIEETFDGFRMCVDTYGKGTRPFLFVVGPDTSIWEFRRESTSSPNRPQDSASKPSPLEMQGDNRNALVATRDIPAGYPLTDFNVVMVEIPASIQVPEGGEFVQTHQEYEQRSLRMSVPAGSLIRKSDLGERGIFNASHQIPKGMRINTFPVSVSQTHGGMLKPEDWVDVKVTFATPKGAVEAKTLLEHVRVFACEEKTSKGEDGQPILRSRYITLLVTPEQDGYIEIAKTKGQLSLSLRNPDDDELVNANGLDADVLDALRHAIKPGEPPPTATTELDGDWHLLWMEEKGFRKRSPGNLSIHGNAWTFSWKDGQCVAEMAIDQRANIRWLSLKGDIASPDAPKIPKDNHANFELQGDRLTVRHPVEQRTYVWVKGAIDLQTVRRRPEGMVSFSVLGDKSATHMGQLLPGDKVDVFAEWKLPDGTTTKRMVVERVEVDAVIDRDRADSSDPFLFRYDVTLLVSVEQKTPLQEAFLRSKLSVTVREPGAEALQYPDGINAGVITEIKAAAGADPVTPLEGDWYLESEDMGGNITGQRMNLTIRGDVWSLESIHTENVKSHVGQKNGHLIINKKNQTYSMLDWPKEDPRSGEYVLVENRRWRDGKYELSGDTLILMSQLTLSLTPQDALSPNGVAKVDCTMTWKKGHRKVIPALPQPSDTQRLRWRSAVVEIYQVEYDSLNKVGQSDFKKPEYGAVVSSDGLIVTQVPNGTLYFDNPGSYPLYARFDDGSLVKLTAVEDAGQGWLALKPEKELKVNHFFPLATTPTAIADEVYAWGTNTSVGEHFLQISNSRVMLLNRRVANSIVPVWQLLRPELFGPISAPVLSGDGELLGMTMPGTGDLLLALPTSRLKEMFPKTFAAPPVPPVAPAQ